LVISFAPRSTCGFTRALVGLSGGLDSAVACYLAAEALGPANVLAVRMPYKTSSAESLEHAHQVVEATGVEEATIPITEMVDAHFVRFPEADTVRRGNAMARARMIVLYDQSAASRGLVVGTGNKTEILLGYTTLFGDAACAINPLGDLYKTQVRQRPASASRRRSSPKPPSANSGSQTDEESWGSPMPRWIGCSSCSSMADTRRRLA
jgi:NAD+ synthase